MPVRRRKIGEIPTLLVPDGVVLGCQMKEEAIHFSYPDVRLFRQVPRTDELPRRVYLRYLNAEWPEVGRFEVDVAKSLSTAADTRPLTKGCRVRWHR